MGLAEGIRKHGFRKWYERELLQSHAHMVLTFLCAIGVFAAFEAFHTVQPWTERVFDAVVIVVCAVVGVWALRRYLYLLNHAEYTANQADCPQCKTYARFALESEDQRNQTVLVCCRKCGHRWTISE
jgi:hypothetical protein